jgi:hypothetical protein
VSLRLTIASFLLGTVICPADVERHPVRLHLEPVVYEESMVWPLFEFLDIKVAKYRVVSDEPFDCIHAHVSFRERDASGKLVETEYLDGGCCITHGSSGDIVTFLLSPEKAYIAACGLHSGGDGKETKFLQRVKGEYYNWASSPDAKKRSNKIEIYSVEAGGGGKKGEKIGSIELELTAESLRSN